MIPNISGSWRRDHYCIHHILSGSGCYCTGTVSKHLEEGDTFILYPGVELRYQADADKPWNMHGQGLWARMRRLLSEIQNLAGDSVYFKREDSDRKDT